MYPRANFKSESWSSINHVSRLLFLIYLWRSNFLRNIPDFGPNEISEFSNDITAVVAKKKHSREGSFHEFWYVSTACFCMSYWTKDKIVLKSQFLFQMSKFRVSLMPHRPNIQSENWSQVIRSVHFMYLGQLSVSLVANTRQHWQTWFLVQLTCWARRPPAKATWCLEAGQTSYRMFILTFCEFICILDTKHRGRLSKNLIFGLTDPTNLLKR